MARPANESQAHTFPDHPAKRPFVRAMVLFQPSPDQLGVNSREPLAAMVVEVNQHDVNLQVFTTMRIFPRHNVPYDANKTPGSWRWGDEEQSDER